MAAVPKVSVIIVNFGAYLELNACLESLEYHDSRALYQTDGVADLEITVVDHASDSAAAEALSDRFPHVRFIATDANPGFSAGINRGARGSLARYLLVLNPDCVLHGDLAGQLSAWLDSHPRVAIAGPQINDHDGTLQASARRFPNFTTFFAGRSSWLTRRWPGNPWTRRNLVEIRGASPIDVDWVSGACMMIRREAFESIGGFDEGYFLYWEDADLCFRARRAGWSVMYVPEARVTHLAGRSSAKAHIQSLRAFHRSAYRYFRKNGGRLAQVAAPMVFLALQARVSVKLAVMELRRRRE